MSGKQPGGSKGRQAGRTSKGRIREHLSELHLLWQGSLSVLRRNHASLIYQSSLKGQIRVWIKGKQ